MLKDHKLICAPSVILNKNELSERRNTPMIRSKTLALIIVVLFLGAVGVNLLKSGPQPDETGSRVSYTDITGSEEPKPPAVWLSLIPAYVI
jgi:hypothetical protein